MQAWGRRVQRVRAALGTATSPAARQHGGAWVLGGAPGVRGPDPGSPTPVARLGPGQGTMGLAWLPAPGPWQPGGTQPRGVQAGRPGPQPLSVSCLHRPRSLLPSRASPTRVLSAAPRPPRAPILLPPGASASGGGRAGRSRLWSRHPHVPPSAAPNAAPGPRGPFSKCPPGSGVGGSDPAARGLPAPILAWGSWLQTPCMLGEQERGRGGRGVGWGVLQPSGGGGGWGGGGGRAGLLVSWRGWARRLQHLVLLLRGLAHHLPVAGLDGLDHHRLLGVHLRAAVLRAGLSEVDC